MDSVRDPLVVSEDILKVVRNWAQEMDIPLSCFPPMIAYKPPFRPSWPQKSRRLKRKLGRCISRRQWLPRWLLCSTRVNSDWIMQNQGYEYHPDSFYQYLVPHEARQDMVRILKRQLKELQRVE